MTTTHPTFIPFRRRTFLIFATLSIAALVACSHTMAMIRGTGAKRPDAAEFGLGPRTSAHGHYVATLDPGGPLRTRQMLTMRVTLRDAAGRAIDDAEMAIDGGMPQHGHGLPTRPRVTRQVGAGVYLVEGVRFNMGGWWEFTLALAGPDGADTVTFNLDL